MARIEKTVFISYRRKDLSWALLVYKYLTENGFDVFLDFTNLSAGKFRPVIISNIKARAHFLVILTPSALDRCNEPGDWLRHEIEIAISEKRNIVPLFFDGFDFADSAISDKLSGRLKTLRKYMGLEVPALFFDAAMKKLRDQFLNVALDTKSYPLPDEVQKIVEEQQNAANKAIEQDSRLKSSGLRVWWNKQTDGVKAAYITGIFTLIAALLGVLLNTYIGNGPTPTPTPTMAIPVPTINSPNGRCELAPGGSIPLAVSGVPGSGVVYSWSASRGNVTPSDGPTVLYTAPDMAGDVIIRVEARMDGQSSDAVINCEVMK